MVRKAVVDAKTFSSALDQVSKVLRKSSIPVLAEALVSISDGQCTLTATDIETYLFQTVPARGDDLSFVFRKTKDVAKGRGSTGVSPKPSRVKRARLLYHSSRALVFYYAILFQHRFSSVFKAETITG